GPDGAVKRVREIPDLLDLNHKLANVDQVYRDMLCSAPFVVKYLSNPITREHLSMHRIRRLSVAFAVAGVLGVAAPAAASALTTISISGATASYPLVSLLAQKYVKVHPHKVKFKIAQGGAQIGVNDVAAGRVTIGDVSRDPERKDPAGLVFYPIAKYAICVITNKANTLSNLTQSQLISVFTGKTPLLERRARGDGQRDDRPDQPHVGGWSSHQLPDATARRQESARAARNRRAL